MSLKKYGESGYFLANDPVFQHFVRVLTEEHPRTNVFIEQDLIDPTLIEYVLVFLESGAMRIKYHRRGARFRRYKERLLRRFRKAD